LITIGINPVAFTIGSISINWYGIFITLAILTVVSWALRQVRKQSRLSYDRVITAAMIGIPSGVIISRLLHVVDRWSYYSQNPGQIVGTAGLTIYGAVLGATLGVWIYSKLSRLQFGYLVDLLAPGIILSQTVGRVGCTLNGCCYGLETSLPWGVIYTHPDSFGPLRIPVHPTQVYEIIFCLIGFAVLLKLRGRLRPEGSLFLVYLSLYSAWRFGISFLRDGTVFLLGLQQAQVIGLIVLAIAISLLAYRTRWIKKG